MIAISITEGLGYGRLQVQSSRMVLVIFNYAAIVSDGFGHFQLRVTFFVHCVTFFVHRVILEQIFVGPTHDVKIELQLVISIVQIFEVRSWPLTVQDGEVTVDKMEV